MQIGTKELKNQLSRYLRQVRRGEVIAELRSPLRKKNADADSLMALEAEGIVTIGRGKARDFTPVRARRSASDIVMEDRG